MTQESTAVPDKMKRLRAKFIDSLEARLEDTENCFNKVKAKPTDAAASEGLQTAFHNLKGLASVFGFVELSEIASRGELQIDEFIKTSGKEPNTGFGEKMAALVQEVKTAGMSIATSPKEAPAPESTEDDGEVESATPPAGTPGKTRVVIVDDEGLMRSVLKSMLKDAGYQVVGEATNGASALTHCANLTPDLVLLDINMPGSNGLDVLQDICQKYPQIKVIMVSAHGSSDKVNAAISAGAVGFVVKPFNATAVLKQVERFFPGRPT